MRLEDYWGVGPKTAARLEETLGTAAAIEAIDSADVGALTRAGLSRGRATAILRRAQGGDRLDVLATRDARSVYKDLLSLARSHAVTEDAADRISVLTPLGDPEAMRERTASTLAAAETWRALSDADREAVLSAFETHDDGEDPRLAAVETALALAAVGVDREPLDVVASLPTDDLEAAAEALRTGDGDTVRPGADAELDRLRERRAAADRLADGALDVLESVRADGARDLGTFREELIEHVIAETGIEGSVVREATPDDAASAADFVSGTLRTLAETTREAAAARERELLAEANETLDATAEAVERAERAVADAALTLSLGRFAAAYDLRRPQLVPDGDVLAVTEARNLSLAAAGGDVQPVSYAVGDHDLGTAPSGDAVTVLTGANSGGKTTLLETLCQVAILAQLGLPVPADRATVGVVDAVVFHRRHASFNAGVLEATLRAIVPPLAGGGRTLMLVDEFEAITEPGSAAALLHGLVSLTVDRGAVGVFVTHLADDLKPLPDPARIDGIVAQGLTSDLALQVDYQPRFGEVGRSTPEFIVSRLVADARDPTERAGFEALARALGRTAVQTTLFDDRFT